MQSDHYKHVMEQVVEQKTAKETEDDQHDSAADRIRASCDRRLSRAARAIVKQKLLQALVDTTTKTTTTITTTTGMDAPPASASSIEMRDLIMSTRTAITLPDILASDDPAKFSIWELLESLQVSAAANSRTSSSNASSATTCLLQCQRDVLRYHEELVSIIPADLQGRRNVDTPTANRRHVNQKAHPYWYQCLLCGKVFSSRFYLDRHLETHHRPPPPETELSKDNDDNNRRHDDELIFWMCPATDWCGNFLSMSACHEMALTLEPHYGPGSQGRRRQDRVNVERQLWKEAHEQPCSTMGMQTATTSCHDMIQSCFLQQPPPLENTDNSSSDNTANSYASGQLFAFATSQRIGQVLDKSLCSTLSCPDRLHRLFFKTKTGGDLVMRHVHEWEEEWIYWAEDHHEVGWVGLLLLLSLVIWYANALLEHIPPLPRPITLVPSYFRQGDGSKRRIPNAQGSRLLRKSPAKASTARGRKSKEN